MVEEKISSARHLPEQETGPINQAVKKSIEDRGFLDYAIGFIAGMQFPAFKNNILDHIRKVTSDRDVLALYDSLDGYIKFKDAYHVRKSFEENNPYRKRENQITDKTRENPDVKTRDTVAGTSIKEREAVNENEERKDYPEVTPTAMSNFVCDMCGKPFQNQNDLVQHQRFESGTIKKEL